MTQVTTETGETIETNLPEDKVADLQAQPANQPEADPKPQTEEQQPEPHAKPAEAPAEETKEDPKPETSRNPETGKFTRKAGPIAELLEKKHQAEERAAQAEAKAADLEAKIQQLSQAAPSVQTDDKIKAFAEANDLDENLVNGLVQLAREGLSPQLPKEVQELLQERELQKATELETQAFNKRVDALANTFKDDQLKDPAVRQKLMQLAYSTELAPDGEAYNEKELAELYIGFIKPEIEPGTVSAEPSRGGTQTTQVFDFAEIHNDEAKLEEFAKTATSEQWQAYTKWRDERAPGESIIRKNT